MAARRFSIHAPAPADLGKAGPAAKVRAQTAAKPPPVAPSSPVAIPGSAAVLSSFVPRPVTPQQGGEGRRSQLLRQASDGKLDALANSASAEDASAIMAAPPAKAHSPYAADQQALGSWAGRQTVLPLPPRPVGFPAPATKARLQAPVQRPQRSADDAAWRHRFRQRWRREQLRALLDAPDASPNADALHGRASLDSLDDDDSGMVFHLEGAPAATAPKETPELQEALTSDAPGGRPDIAAAALSAQQAAPPAAAAAPPPLPLPPLPLRNSADINPPAVKAPSPDALLAAVPGLPPIRKAVMRGRNTNGGGASSKRDRGPVAKAGPAAAAGGAGARGVKVQAPLERRWVPPGWTSPARASQAA